MLRWIKGSKSDHPLGDEKTTHELLSELPPNDPFKSLEELTYWLDSLIGTDELRLPRVFAVVDLIDQIAKIHQRRLSQDYLAGSARQQKTHEIRIWNTVFSFWKQLSDAYQTCLARVQAGAAGVGSLKAQTPVIIARALRALTLQLKWQQLRYGPVAPRLWEQYGKLYAYAEEKNIATSRIVVYPGKFGESTVQRELMKGLMLGISSTDSLLPNKLEVAERVIAQFSEFFVMNRQPAKGCHYYFDLAAGRQPARMVSRLQATPGLRFFGPGNAALELEKLIATVQADGVVPSEINLGGTFDPELVLGVLRHLARYWAPEPPARSAERRQTVSRISVVHDFDEIVATISGETDELTFDSNTETWTVENESDGGYGALMPMTRSDWLRVGSLLGLKLEDGASWSVGVVRRLSAFDLQQRYVGIQLLSRGAAVVRIAALNAPGGNGGSTAVLLPSHATDSTSNPEMNLLLRPGSFSLHKSMEMRAYDRDYVLLPRQLIENGQDFDMVRVRVMQRPT